MSIEVRHLTLSHDSRKYKEHIMSGKENHRSKKYIIVWTLFCLIGGFTAATLLDPVSTPEAQTSPVLPGAPGSFSNLVKKASQSVVNISTVKVIKGRGQTPFYFGPNDPFKDYFDRFFRDQIPKEHRQRSLGTGFIIDKEGYILTNNHVVEKTDEIKVTLADKKEFTAKIIGRDPKTDLALIRIESDSPLKTLPFGDSDKLEVGDWVVAIGNPFGLGNTVTAGIVSAKYRQIGAGSYENFIQTDASINPGNSGGPLLNTAGEVVGINTAIFSQSGGSIGIGFAIPINMVKDLLQQLKKGKVVRGWLGVMIQKITSELKEKLDLKDEKSLLAAFDDMAGKFAKFKPAYVVQEQLTEGKEVIIGTKGNDGVAPMVMFGLGGVFVETLKDVQFRLAPLSKQDSEQMISSIKGSPILKGVRGEKPADIEKLEEVLIRVAQLADDFREIDEMDLNPVFTFEKGKGVAVVDARLKIRGK